MGVVHLCTEALVMATVGEPSEVPALFVGRWVHLAGAPVAFVVLVTGWPCLIRHNVIITLE